VQAVSIHTVWVDVVAVSVVERNVSMERSPNDITLIVARLAALFAALTAAAYAVAVRGEGLRTDVMLTLRRP
jgi:hypothetical protein